MAKIVNRGDRPRMQSNPELPVRITDRKQIKQGHRGHTWVWFPTGQASRIVSGTGLTGGLGVGLAGVAGQYPADTTQFLVMITINANTNTSGQARAMALRDKDGTVGNDAALHLSQEMGNNTWRSRIVGPVPMNDGGIYWTTETSGTVNYDVFIDVVGYVLE